MRTSMTSASLTLLFVAIQLVMTNYLSISPVLTLTLLPAIIMCLPTSFSTITVMVISFCLGLTVDFLGEGVIGMTACAAVPVAAMRNFVIELVVGREIIERGSDFNFRKNGFSKVAMVMAIPLAAYLLIFIMVDGAGMRPFWFNLVRFVSSFAASFVLCLMTVKTLNPDDRR